MLLSIRTVAHTVDVQEHGVSYDTRRGGVHARRLCRRASGVHASSSRLNEMQWVCLLNVGGLPHDVQSLGWQSVPADGDMPDSQLVTVQSGEEYVSVFPEPTLDTTAQMQGGAR
jgi:hypothetical protein